MRFLDSNIILYAYLKPKRKSMLSKKILWRKQKSKEILERIENKKEHVLISTSHLGEILNILSSKSGIEPSQAFLSKILTLENITIASVTKKHYEKALVKSLEYCLDPNDALAAVIMEEHNCDEIYTFDSDFKNIATIKPILLLEEEKIFKNKPYSKG
nr:type II toxin-antitoxin system VapC family toxin [Candidatus Baldrarchaeota archaeon]